MFEASLLNKTTIIVGNCSLRSEITSGKNWEDFSHEEGYHDLMYKSFGANSLISDDPSILQHKHILSTCCSREAFILYLPCIDRVLIKHLCQWQSKGSFQFYKQFKKVCSNRFILFFVVALTSHECTFSIAWTTVSLTSFLISLFSSLLSTVVL